MALKVNGTTVVNNSRVLLNHRIDTKVVSADAAVTTGSFYVALSPLTLTLPVSPEVGEFVGVSNQSDTQNVIISVNGSKINGVAEDMTVDQLNASFSLQYTGADRGWIIF